MTILNKLHSLSKSLPPRKFHLDGFQSGRNFIRILEEKITPSLSTLENKKNTSDHFIRLPSPKLNLIKILVKETIKTNIFMNIDEDKNPQQKLNKSLKYTKGVIINDNMEFVPEMHELI